MVVKPSTFPPFPEDVPTHSLPIVDYALIKAGDEKEINKLWKAATELGFWYLKNHGVDGEVEDMFDLGAQTMDLPLEEKQKFAVIAAGPGVSFGYKAAGLNVVDETGRPDTIEFLNISQDDALAWPSQVHRAYPSTVNAGMSSTVVPFVRKSVEVNLTLLDVFNEKLGLPEGLMRTKHAPGEWSGSLARCTKSPPQADVEDKGIGAHTDFGSLSFLHNRLGGLQVCLPGTTTWKYVKPIPGHAICNLGDAMTIFSGGILKSCLHRVVPPPGLQSRFDRFSLVFFTRPANGIMLRALKEESKLIAESVEKYKDAGLDFEPHATAAEWYERRSQTRKTSNWKGLDSWKASRGTEHQRLLS